MSPLSTGHKDLKCGDSSLKRVTAAMAKRKRRDVLDDLHRSSTKEQQSFDDEFELKETNSKTFRDQINKDDLFEQTSNSEYNCLLHQQKANAL
jgi:hypothetical protein